MPSKLILMSFDLEKFILFCFRWQKVVYKKCNNTVSDEKVLKFKILLTKDTETKKKCSARKNILNNNM